jgi:hypothetical protein
LTDIILAFAKAYAQNQEKYKFFFFKKKGKVEN